MSRRRKLLVAACAVVATVLVLRGQSAGDGQAPPPAAAAPRRVTPSLAEVARPPLLSDHVVLFNRVPKSGGEMLVLLLQWLQGRNGFRHVRLGGGDRRRLSHLEQELLVDEVMQIIRDEAVPVSFDRHVYFLNFSMFDRQSPMYINLIRDPVDKAASRYYYHRATPNPNNPDLLYAPDPKLMQLSGYTFDECVLSRNPECTYINGQSYDLSIPYFCGHHDWCMEHNNIAALEEAKRNVDRYFPVVGVLDELNATLVALERKIPYFFKGVQQMYFKELLKPHKNKNNKRPEVGLEARRQLTSILETEYEFYHWVRRRLLIQAE